MSEMRLLAVIVAACCPAGPAEPKPPPAPDAPAAEAPLDVGRLRAVANEMCACPDRACAERVTLANAELEKDVERRFKGVNIREVPVEILGVVEQLEACDERIKTRELGAFRDRMCACTDEACARDVAAELAKAPANDLNDATAPEPAAMIAAYKACKAKLVHD